MKLLALLLLNAGLLVVWGQPIAVYSEFARIDGSGQAVAPESPREILSPAIARGAYASFQVVIRAAPEQHWHLFIGQNPENSVGVTLYRENSGALERVDLPYEADGAQVFWMDLWVDRGAKVQRIKVEPEVYLNDDWVIYPMEARVMEATVPDGSRPDGSRPEGSAESWEVMRGFLCGGGGAAAGAAGEAVSMARLRFRNAQQDLALAGKAPKDELQKLFGPCDAPASPNPEAYLRIRDYLLRLR